MNAKTEIIVRTNFSYQKNDLFTFSDKVLYYKIILEEQIPIAFLFYSTFSRLEMAFLIYQLVFVLTDMQIPCVLTIVVLT